jgi:hypothetical protein
MRNRIGSGSLRWGVLVGGPQRRLAEEYERCAHYLDPATRRPLVAAAEAQLLERHMGAILERGFDALMAEQRVPDLARCRTTSAKILGSLPFMIGATVLCLHHGRPCSL